LKIAAALHWPLSSDGFRKSLAANRSKFYPDLAARPFYGFSRAEVEADPGLIQNWWRRGMIGLRRKSPGAGMASFAIPARS